MASPSLARRLGLTGNRGCKAPVRAATTANITLSGEQTCGGVALVTGDRCLVWQQTTATQNGVYDVSTGAWTRSIDANGTQDWSNGTIGIVSAGTYADQFWINTTADPVIPDTSSMSFAVGVPVLPVLAASDGAALVGFHSGSGRTVEQQLDMLYYGMANITDPQFAGGADPTGVSDSTAAIQAALDSGFNFIYAPPGTYNHTQLFVRANNIDFSGSGNSTVLNCTSTSVFCSIALVELYTGIKVHDLEMRGAVSSEPSGPAPLRGIVNGTNTAGTAHSTQVWNAFNHVYRVHITGAIPGTNGFNVGCQFNYANYSTFDDCTVESLYGTASSFGYGVVCNGRGNKITNNRFLATIIGQGRHAVYMTNTPFDITCQGNMALNFQNEAYTSNTGGSTSGTFGYLKVLDNSAFNCMQVGTGSSPQQAVIDINAPYSIVARNTIVGSAFAGISVFNVNEVIVNDNIINGVTEHGIWVSTCSSLKITGNQIVNPDSAGTSNYGGVEIITSSRVQVNDNRISGANYRFGVRFNATATVPSGCQVFDNTITGSYSTDIENEFIDSTNCVRRPRNEPRNMDYTPGATTVNVSQNVTRIGSITNSGSVSITNLTGAVKGQTVIMMFYDANTTVARGNFILAGGVDFVSTNRSSLTVSYNGAAWDEVTRAVSVS